MGVRCYTRRAMTSNKFTLLLAPLRTVLLFSLAVNLALLAPSIFMLQVFDRVLSTRSVETLLVMAVIALVTLALMGVLEYLRTRALSGIGVMLEQEHGPRILAQLMRSAARQGGRSYLDGMRDLATVRAFLGGPGVVALCDAPWTVVYLFVIYLFHPALGLLAAVFTTLLVLLAWLNERTTRTAIGQLTDSSRRAGRLVDGGLRNAEVVAALGMQTARLWLGQYFPFGHGGFVDQFGHALNWRTIRHAHPDRRTETVVHQGPVDYYPFQHLAVGHQHVHAIHAPDAGGAVTNAFNHAHVLVDFDKVVNTNRLFRHQDPAADEVVDDALGTETDPYGQAAADERELGYRDFQHGQSGN